MKSKGSFGDNLINIINAGRNLMNGQITGHEPTLFACQTQINDYCDYLIKKNSGEEGGSNNSNNLVRFKVLEICEKMGIEVTNQNNVMENLNKISEAADDIVSIKRKSIK